MRKFILLVMAALLVIPAVPAFAGSGEKCKGDTQTCLNQFSSYRDKGWLGLKLDMKESGQQVVLSAMPGSPAEKAGFKAGDVLVAVNGAKFADKEAVKKAKGDWKPDQQVTYTVTRDNAETAINVTLAPMPEEVYAAMVGQHMIENHMVVATETKAEAGKK